MRVVLALVIVLLVIAGGLVAWSWWRTGEPLGAFLSGLQDATAVGAERLANAPCVTIRDDGLPLAGLTLAIGGAELAVAAPAAVRRHRLRVFEENDGRPGCQPPPDVVTSAFSGDGGEEHVRVAGAHVGAGARQRVEGRIELGDGTEIVRVAGAPIRSWPPPPDTDWSMLAALLDLGLVVEMRVDDAAGTTRVRLREFEPRQPGQENVMRLGLAIEGGPRSAAAEPGQPDGRVLHAPAASLQRLAGAGVRLTVHVDRDAADPTAVAGIRIVLDPAR